MKKAFVISLKFSPGHYSHMKALYALLEELEIEPYLYVDKSYEAFLKHDNNIRHIYADEDGPVIKPDIVFFQNPAVKNHIKAVYFRDSCSSKVIYIYHEPWDGICSYFKEGPKQRIKAVAAHYYSAKLIKLCDYVLVPSMKALGNYIKYDARNNENAAYFPLIFTDENENKRICTKEKTYFSYIGHAEESHQFHRYVDFMKYCIENHRDIKFLIATRSNIGSLIQNTAVKEGLEDGRVKVINKKMLTNEEINKCFIESLCVWNLYKRSTQSGVMPKSLMFGTPVIASSTGSFKEYIEGGYNGMILDICAGFDEIYEALMDIKKNILTYSYNARDTFEKNFYYKANIGRMKEIIDGITC